MIWYNPAFRTKRAISSGNFKHAKLSTKIKCQIWCSFNPKMENINESDYAIILGDKIFV